MIKVPTPFRLLRTRCGLSVAEAAQVLDVRRDTAESWDLGRRTTPARVLAELRALAKKIERAGGALGARVDALKRNADGAVVLVVATTDLEAERLGFPCAAAHQAATAAAIAALPDDVEVELRAWREDMPAVVAIEDDPAA